MLIDLRWLAPVPVDFSCVVGAADRSVAEYESFWRDVERELGDAGATFHHARTMPAGLAYVKAAGDTLPRPLEVVTGEVSPDSVAALVDAFDGVECTELQWSLLDHGVALVEGRVRVDIDLPAGPAAVHCEQILQQVGEMLAAHCVTGPLSRVVEAAHRHPQGAGQVVVTNEGHGSPLWVARALHLDVADESQVDFARAWLTGVDADADELVDALVEGRRANVTRWLNYIYRDDVDTSVQWTALRRAQYLYAAMGEVDAILRQILAWSMVDDKQVSLVGLRRELEQAVNRAQTLLLLKAEIGKHASRISRWELEGILRRWDYAEVLDDPVRHKLQICQQRLEALAADRSARSSMFTDVILMTIGVTSILSTALSLVSFGRDSANDAQQSKFDLGAGAITAWFASQPIDAIVVISSVVSLVLVITFLLLRRNSIS